MKIIHRLSTFAGYMVYGKSKYYLHSPFLYQFKTDVLKDKNKDGRYRAAEQILQECLANNDILKLQGAGAKKIIEGRVKDIARNHSIPQKYGRLLLRIASHFQSKKIIELGAALGIGTAYLSAADAASRVDTFDAEKSFLQLARRQHASQGLTNINYVDGNIDETLPGFLSSYNSFDLAFIDANHTYEATVKYFKLLSSHGKPGSIIVLDDIHWSGGMTKAWNEIIGLPEVTLSIDLYRMGIIFFEPNLSKQNFRIWF